MATSNTDRGTTSRAFLWSGSVYEPMKSINLLKPDAESLWDKLDHYYCIVKATVLVFQSPTTGLFPTKTCSENPRAKIHDSLYCAACVWALALAYR
ncbi:putative Phosphorylase b kinase regulatory subunit protein [Naja naja]|nr:putative Phosphorylase b kinase regulatory subunit protein [Naja naja]